MLIFMLALFGCAQFQTPSSPADICGAFCACKTIFNEACQFQNVDTWGAIQGAVDMVDCLNQCESAPEQVMNADYLCLSDAYVQYTLDPNNCPDLSNCF